jgi:hypothetical protein
MKIKSNAATAFHIMTKPRGAVLSGDFEQLWNAVA